MSNKHLISDLRPGSRLPLRALAAGVADLLCGGSWWLTVVVVLSIAVHSSLLMTFTTCHRALTP